MTMRRGLTAMEIMAFLRRVARGTITLVPTRRPQEVYAGVVEYKASNGWTIHLFNDCGEWDYIESVETDDGRTRDFDWIWENAPMVRFYHPSDKTAWKRWGIPGHCKFRCDHCGKRISRDTVDQDGPWACSKRCANTKKAKAMAALPRVWNVSKPGLIA